jgi:hypothetical protein
MKKTLAIAPTSNQPIVARTPTPTAATRPVRRGKTK